MKRHSRQVPVPSFVDASFIFNNLKISKKDLEEILFCYYMEFVNNKDVCGMQIQDIDEENADIKEITKFIINNLYLKLMLKEYKRIKDYYFKNNKETMFLQNRNLQNQICDFEKDLKITNEKLESLVNDYEKLEKENRRLRKRLETKEDNKVELVELREFLFNMDNQNVDIVMSQIYHSVIGNSQ